MGQAGFRRRGWRRRRLVRSVIGWPPACHGGNRKVSSRRKQGTKGTAGYLNDPPSLLDTLRRTGRHPALQCGGRAGEDGGKRTDRAGRLHGAIPTRHTAGYPETTRGIQPYKTEGAILHDNAVRKWREKKTRGRSGDRPLGNERNGYSILAATTANHADSAEQAHRHEQDARRLGDDRRHIQHIERIIVVAIALIVWPCR